MPLLLVHVTYIRACLIVSSFSARHHVVQEMKHLLLSCVDVDVSWKCVHVTGKAM